MSQLEKAELRQLDTATPPNEIEQDHWVKVQFNPETLKVSFTNQLQTPSGGGDQSGTPARLFVGAGTTKLSVQLWFDVSAPQQGTPENDVRKLTAKVAYYITPQPDQDDATKLVPPAVRFLWGSFQFDGMVESMEESLELFSPEGRPLRASVTLGLSQQRITAFTFRDTPPPSGRSGQSPPGTRPLTPAPEGSTLQGLAAGAGKGQSWQGIAAANGIENPRLLQTGQSIDMNRTVRIR